MNRNGYYSGQWQVEKLAGRFSDGARRGVYAGLGGRRRWGGGGGAARGDAGGRARPKDAAPRQEQAPRGQNPHVRGHALQPDTGHGRTRNRRRLWDAGKIPAFG